MGPLVTLPTVTFAVPVLQNALLAYEIVVVGNGLTETVVIAVLEQVPLLKV